MPIRTPGHGILQSDEREDGSCSSHGLMYSTTHRTAFTCSQAFC